MANPIEVRNSKLGPKVVKALQNRRFDAWYVEEPQEAAEKVFSLIPKGDVIGWGGSLTVEALGLTKLAREKGYSVLDRDAVAPENRLETMRKVMTCDTFLCSSNAISEDGQLVNIDGFGNRVAAMIFGPKQVILVAGMNKVVKTLEDAYTRTRTIAAPMNAQRFPQKKTPCLETGSCANCNSPDSICTFIVATRLCNPPGRIKVILIGKDLGL
ncbi:lactate utilization protein [Treponema primitia]|uniref:lactate utilization protein n=1 Tax=Treponema primitia TaxID=88058 RepID=UPI00397EC0D9